MTSYEIPPAPKPFTGRYSPARYTPSPRAPINNEVEFRSPQSNEHYIAFPPSGLPVHCEYQINIFLISKQKFNLDFFCSSAN